MDKPIKTHQTCPECGHHGCLSIWSDGGMKCHSCGYTKGSGKTGDDGAYYGIDPNIKTSKHVPYRNLDLDVVKLYDIKTGFDASGTEVRREYLYPHGTKTRYLPKDFSKNRGFKANRLFGMDKFPTGSSKTITITEGEDDAPAAYQMLNKRSPVVSLPGAGISSDLIQECSDYLNGFEQIVVCTDNDKAGESAAKRLATAFPNKVYLCRMSEYKDPQEFLEAGKQREFFFMWNNRKKHVPADFWNTPDQFTDILNKTTTQEFIETPISELNSVTSGLAKGHLTVITGPEGQGKTEVLRFFEHHILKNHPDKVIGVLHMEESRKTCLESYACYELGENIRNPHHKVPRKDIDKAITDLTKNHNLWLFDFHIDEDPLAILDKVRYLTVACECDFIFIDPIQQLAYGKQRDQSEEQTLSQISVQLERLATELNVGIVMTTHVNDDGQTRSSRMIGKSASVRIDLNRDHMNPDEDIRNRTRLSVSKNRPTGTTGYAGDLLFDPKTFTISEVF